MADISISCPEDRDFWSWTLAGTSLVYPFFHNSLQNLSNGATLVMPIVGLLIAFAKLWQIVRKEMARMRIAEAAEAARKAAEAIPAKPKRKPAKAKQPAKGKHRAQTRKRRA